MCSLARGLGLKSEGLVSMSEGLVWSRFVWSTRVQGYDESEAAVAIGVLDAD
jgi:hypothetical protein